MVTTSSFCAFPCGNWQCHRLILRHEKTRWAALYGTVGHSRQGIPCCSRDRCTVSRSGPARERQRCGQPEVLPQGGRIVHEPLQISFRDTCSAVPKPPAEAFRRALEQHWIAGKTLCLDEPLNGCLDMLHTHGDVPPVENMLHRGVAVGGISDQIWQSWLAVRDHRQQTAWLPSEV